jgi:hypothetical protein
MLARLISNGRNGFGAIALLLLCGTPVFAAIYTMAFAFFVAFVQWIAKIFGGRGTFDQLAYVFAAIGVPFYLISSVFSLIFAIPLVGFCIWPILVLFSLYIIILHIIAAKGVNQFGWGQAAASVLIPGVVIFISCFCLYIVGIATMVGGLAAMGPTINQFLQQMKP